jgi:hypothetical protein
MARNLQISIREQVRNADVRSRATPARRITPGTLAFLQSAR